jgi:cellulose synthase/poly-beta-1,6-N-acetylglucosamine synthase-like glycosyltransferase
VDEISLPGLALCILTLICLALALHPFTTYPISLRLLARLRPRPLQPGHGPAHDPTVAMCVCAYNEEGVIAARVDNMLALRRRTPHLEILVYVDAATDRTVEILRRYGEAIRVVVGAERHGKTHGMNRLVGMTGADIVVFSDANVSFAEDALQRLVAPFADPSVGCVCGHLVYLEPGQAGGGLPLLAAGGTYQGAGKCHRVGDGCRWLDLRAAPVPACRGAAPFDRRHVCLAGGADRGRPGGAGARRGGL